MKRLYYSFAAIFVVFLFLACSRTEKAAVGSAPPFVLSTIKSDRLNLGDYRGKVVLLEFFASWCPPCRMMAPELKSVYEKYRGKGLIVLAIAIDDGPEALSAVKNFVNEFSVPYPVMIDDGTVSRQYQVISIPTSFIIDKQGKITNRHIGLLSDLTGTLSKEIEILL
ncbi:MAG TPA: TlpA disulfide reductase family protein [Dissulfurispiraceae bacterium]|nr:TlpA disulfide reductase family protein [Dissulfurispiraceae bacterium]